MASGGARARSGPAPDPNALRRDRDKAGEWIDLPSAGREGDPPEWPFDGVRQSELDLWAELWAKPQAVEWQRNRQELEVALLVRAISTAQGEKSTAADGSLVQRKMNDLGLTVPGLRANRWRIRDGGALAASQVSRARSMSARERLKVVKDAPAAEDDGGSG